MANKAMFESKGDAYFLLNWQTNVTKQVLDEATYKLGLQQDKLHHVGGFKNKIYTFNKNSSEFILRLSHNSHRTEEQTSSEMDWVSFLANNSVNVSKPQPFQTGKLVERIETDQGYFLLTMFTKAVGSQISGESPEWRPKIFEEWGKITGKMHKLAKRYVASEGIVHRNIKDNLITESIENLTEEKSRVLEKYQETASTIGLLSRDDNTFGLCHRDLHHGNFFVHNGSITAFDFDDCGYDLFIQDVAMAVYYASTFANWNNPETNRSLLSNAASKFLESYLKGYESENMLSLEDYNRLPLYIERRRCELTYVLYDFLKNPSSNPAQQLWLEHNLHEIYQGIPCIEKWSLV